MQYSTLGYFFVLACAAGLLYSSPLRGQDRDAGLWTSVGVEAKVVKKLSVAIAQEVRFNENLSEAGTILTEAGISYKINKNLQVSANYRYTRKRRVDDFYGIRHRLYADVKYSHKIKPITIQYRARLQDEYADIGRSAKGGIPEYYLRNKLSLSWDLDKPYSPYLSAELFSPLNYPRYAAFDNLRASAGVEYELTKHHKIDVYYMIQKEMYVSRPQTDFIVGLGYSYKL